MEALRAKKNRAQGPAQIERREGSRRSGGKLTSIDGWPSRIERRECQREQIEAPDPLYIEAGGVRTHRAQREAHILEDGEQS